MGIRTPTSSIPSPGPPSSCKTPHPPTVVVPTRPSPSATSPQRSQVSPNTPQSLTTPRSHRFGYLDHSQKCSAIYEDSASERSFVTANSGETEPGPGIITKHDIPSTAELVIYPQDQEQEQTLEHPEEREGDVQERPSSQKGAKGPSSAPATLQRPRGAGRMSVMSIASTTVKNESIIGDDGVIEETATVVDDDQFIMERWMKTLFYSTSGGEEFFPTAKGGEQKQHLA